MLKVSVPPETLGSSPGSAAAGCDWEAQGAAHNWPSIVRVRPAGISLSHRALATPVAGRAQCGLIELCFGGRTALDLCLSRVRTGVVAMRQDCNYQLDTMKKG